MLERIRKSLRRSVDKVSGKKKADTNWVRIDGDHLPEGARGVILFEDQEDDGSTTMVEMVLSDNPGDHKAYIRVFETKGNGDQGYMV
jgi:hypothetical protein